jgi:hypothetical protein
MIASWCKNGKNKGDAQYRDRGTWFIPKYALCPKPIKTKEKKAE